MEERIQELININEREGQLTVSSREVAENFKKEHNKVIRAVENHIEDLKQVEAKSGLYFIEDIYTASNGKRNKEYLLTRDGFSLLVMSFNNTRDVLEWKLKYIEAFNEMEKVLHKPKSSMDLLKLQTKALLEVDERVTKVEDEVINLKSLESRVDEKVVDLENNMPLFNVDCDEIQKLVRSKGISVLGGYKSDAYNNRSIRAKVYFDIQAQIKREFQVNTYKGIKRKQIHIAKDLVESYRPPMYLINQIDSLNN